jgi:hypothetical protein
METKYMVQYMTLGDRWLDDNCRFEELTQAQKRLTVCSAAKILKGAQFRIIKRTDEVIPQ